MRILLVLMMLCVWAAPASAKMVKVPRGSINVDQLHDELLARFPAWRGTQQLDGMFVNPPLYVESTNNEIELTVPDDANEAAIRSVVAAHVPHPHVDEEAALRAEDPDKLTLKERVERLETLLNLD